MTPFEIEKTNSYYGFYFVVEKGPKGA